MSKSFSTTNTSTTATDNRQVLDGQSIGVTGSKDTTINYTDLGAFAAATGFALDANKNIQQTAADLFGNSGKIFDASVGLVGSSTDSAVQSAKDAYSSAANAVKDAYAKAQGGQSLQVVAIGILVAVVAGVYLYTKAKA